MMAMIRKESEISGVSINTLLLLFFFEQFLNRIAKSKFKNNLILKGGFLLSSIIGIENRTTLDMDVSLRKATLNRRVVEDMIRQIAGIDLGDGVTFEYVREEEIKSNDDYPGLRVSLIGKIENIRQPFSIDIATGDPITPSAIKYQYSSVFDSNSTTEIFAYNIETIIAEKLQTISSRKLENSRMKDFYDLYLLFMLRKKDINKELLIEAVKNTFQARGTDNNPIEIVTMLEDINGDPAFQDRWLQYCKKNPYVHNCPFDKVISGIEDGVHQYLEENIIETNH